MGFKHRATHQDEATTRRRLPSGISIVAEMDGAIVGTVTLRAPKAESRCAWYLQPGVWSFGQFAVRPDLQRNGLGEKLMREIELRESRSMAERNSRSTTGGRRERVSCAGMSDWAFVSSSSMSRGDEASYPQRGDVEAIARAQFVAARAARRLAQPAAIHVQRRSAILRALGRACSPAESTRRSWRRRRPRLQ